MAQQKQELGYLAAAALRLEAGCTAARTTCCKFSRMRALLQAREYAKKDWRTQKECSLDSQAAATPRLAANCAAAARTPCK